MLDIGNNLIRDLEDIQVLGKLRQLKNLNLLGNPLHQTADAEDTAEYRDQIQALVPSLEILDGKRLETKVAMLPSALCVEHVDVTAMPL